jgi:formylmethanofuran dehydrogenase subunit E-like metal-binding protein
MDILLITDAINRGYIIFSTDVALERFKDQEKILRIIRNLMQTEETHESIDEVLFYEFIIQLEPLFLPCVINKVVTINTT